MDPDHELMFEFDPETFTELHLPLPPDDFYIPPLLLWKPYDWRKVPKEEMTRGTGNQSKVHYQGKDDDFIVYIDSAKAVQNWVKDRSIPLAQVVDSFKIFVTHKHGAQGINDEASKQTLENEFGTHNDDECIIKILEKGTVQESESAERQGPKNDSQGPRIPH